MNVRENTLDPQTRRINTVGLTIHIHVTKWTIFADRELLQIRGETSFQDALFIARLHPLTLLSVVQEGSTLLKMTLPVESTGSVIYDQRQSSGLIEYLNRSYARTPDFWTYALKYVAERRVR